MIGSPLLLHKRISYRSPIELIMKISGHKSLQDFTDISGLARKKQGEKIEKYGQIVIPLTVAMP